MAQMSLSDQIVLAVLASTDAVFLPDRDPSARPRHAVISTRRWSFSNAGVPWSSEKVISGLDEAGRKQVQRALDELVARDHVVSFQPQASKTLGVQLSDAGDRYARALAGLPDVAESLAVVGRLAQLENDPAACRFLGRTWLPETLLAGVAWGENDRREVFVELEEKLLPALVRGWAQSNCSVHGHGWYCLRPAGHEALGRPLPPAELPVRSNAARGQYYYRVNQELLGLAAGRPESEREIGEIPMPVCPLRTASP